MTPSWTSPATLVGLAAALAFSLLCYRDMRRALVVVTGVGALQRVQIGSFSGQQMVQGLLPIEVLATALIGVWVLKHRILGNKPLVRCSFDRPLFLLVPASFLSLVVGFTWFDPLIPLDHMKVSVAFGQIVILLWACGLFLVVANSADRITIRRICRLILWLASPSILLTIVPASARPFLDWSMVFALPAASLAASEFFDTQSVLRRLGLVLLIVAPLAFGLATDKAFFYVYVVVSTLVIVALRARSVLVPLVMLSAAMYLLIAAAVTDSLVPSFVTGLIRTETAQQSLGGRGGAGATHHGWTRDLVSLSDRGRWTWQQLPVHAAVLESGHQSQSVREPVDGTRPDRVRMLRGLRRARRTLRMEALARGARSVSPAARARLVGFVRGHAGRRIFR